MQNLIEHLFLERKRTFFSGKKITIEAMQDRKLIEEVHSSESCFEMGIDVTN